MAEVTAFRNNALPYPVYAQKWTVVLPILDADGDPVVDGTIDSLVSINGDTAGAGATPVQIATTSGLFYLELTVAQMTADIVSGSIGSTTSGAKRTLFTLYPRKLVTLASGTAQGGDTGYITLASGTVLFNDQFNGCLCVQTHSTVVEARVLQVCTASNQQCTVSPAWVTAPANDHTYVIYNPEGRQITTSNIRAISDDSVAADNLESACDNYSATRGLAGTALPDYAADAAGGLVISDAGGFDIDNRCPNSTAISGMNTVYNTDFGTNYDATNDRWKVGLANDTITSDSVAATAVTEIQTGLATSAEIASLATQVSNIAISGSAATVVATGDALITGTQAALSPTNDYTRTYNNNAIRNEIAAAQIGGTGDFIINKRYKFNVGVDGTPIKITAVGYLHVHNSPGGRLIDAYAWTFAAGAGGSWEKVTAAVFTAATSETNQQGQNINLRLSHVSGIEGWLGPDGNASSDGDVWIAFNSTGVNLTAGTTILAIDQMICDYSIYRATIGYADGSIWIDTIAGVDSAVAWRDGTADNAVLTYAHAETLEGLLGINRFRICNNSSLSINGASYDLIDHTLRGDHWALAMTNLDISNATIVGATVTGSSTSPTGTPFFEKCHFGAVTLSPCGAMDCGIIDTITIGVAGEFVFDKVHTHGTAATIDFASAVGTTNVRLPSFHGYLTIANMKAGDTLDIEGAGTLIIDASCTAGTIRKSGQFIFTNNGSGQTVAEDDSSTTVRDLGVVALNESQFVLDTGVVYLNVYDEDGIAGGVVLYKFPFKDSSGNDIVLADIGKLARKLASIV